nr:endoglucanase 8-like [Ipomoea batatas]
MRWWCACRGSPLWERPEDMDTLGRLFAVTTSLRAAPRFSAEIGGWPWLRFLGFQGSDPSLLQIAPKEPPEAYNTARQWIFHFYLPILVATRMNLVWAAAIWLHKATINALNTGIRMKAKTFQVMSAMATSCVLDGNPSMPFILNNDTQDFNPFIPNADALVCNVLPESPSKSEKFTPGGLMFVDCMCNLQRSAAVSFLFVTYGTYLQKAKRTINCGNVVVTPARLIEFAKFQVDYILGNNPMNMSYMVGYGKKYPERAHHRGASLPSIGDHPEPMGCSGWSYLNSSNPNLNLLVGAVVGGPDGNDQFADNRRDAKYSEPTTYVNAPLVGILAYFKAH